MDKAPSKSRRIVTRLLVFLLLGAVVNVAVAWGLSYRFLTRMISPDFQQGYQSTGRDGWQIMREDCWGVTRVQSYRTKDNLGYAFSHGDALPKVLNPWGSGLHKPVNEFIALGEPKDGKSFCESRWLIGAGWPLRALWATEEGQVYITSAIGSEEWSVSLSQGPGIRIQSLGSFDLLPARPAPFCFAVNSIFYSIILWLLITPILVLLRSTRLSKRVMHGLCRKCGYDLQGLPSDSTKCPECAYPLKEVPIVHCPECGASIRVGHGAQL